MLNVVQNSARTPRSRVKQPVARWKNNMALIKLTLLIVVVVVICVAAISASPITQSSNSQQPEAQVDNSSSNTGGAGIVTYSANANSDGLGSDGDEEQPPVGPIGEIRPPVRPIGEIRPPNPFDCLRMGDQDLGFYRDSCNITQDDKGCYNIQCPERPECKDSNGEKHAMRSPEWKENRNDRPFICECVPLSAVYFSVPPRYPGSPPYPPIKSCDLEGCENRRDGDNSWIKPGESIHNDGRTCRCVPGTDPMLMDASTRYHLSCKLDEPIIAPPKICTLLDDYQKSLYDGCNVTQKADGCYDIQCPENPVCVDSDGNKHAKGSTEWKETRNNRKYICECVRPGAVNYMVGPPPPGAPDYPPIKSCDLEGCENRFAEDSWLTPGQEIDVEGRGKCRCVEGTDPGLMDASTRYHLSCPGDLSRIMVETPVEESPAVTVIEPPVIINEPEKEITEPEITEPEVDEDDDGEEEEEEEEEEED